MLRALHAGAVLAVAAGADYKELSPEELVSAMDKNSDGYVDLKEFVAAYTKFLDTCKVKDKDARKRFLEHYTTVHGITDLDGDGRLSQREMDFAEMFSKQYGLLEQKAAEDCITAADIPLSPLHDFGAEFGHSLILQNDVHGDGRIDEHEFLRGMTVAGLGLGNYLEEEEEVVSWLKQTFARADINEDGTLNDREAVFAALICMNALHFGKFADRVLTSLMFQHVDRNKDGFIDREEILFVDAVNDELGRIVVTDFDTGDTDGDGRLDTEEVRKLAGQAWEKSTFNSANQR